MSVGQSIFFSYGTTALFVLLWSSGAIFSKIGLESSSAFAFLILRFAIALTILILVGLYRQRWLPARGSRMRVAATGLLMIGGYSIFYFQALDQGVTPGVLATVLGVQPILTLLLTERSYSARRLAGLMLALSGLVLVVIESIKMTHVSLAGMLCALSALAAITTGAILQKGVKQSPLEVLPLQYGMALLLCVFFTPFEPLEVDINLSFIISLIWLGVVISIVATLLLYWLIHTGNLVNVTSLFYLVPGVTTALDFVFLGNRMPLLSLGGRWS